MLNDFINDEQGLTSIEYGIIAAGMVVSSIAAMQALGTSLVEAFDSYRKMID